MQIFFKKLTLH